MFGGGGFLSLVEGHRSLGLIHYTSSSRREKPEISEEVFMLSEKYKSKQKRERATKKTVLFLSGLARWLGREGAFHDSESQSHPWADRNVESRCSHTASRLW